MIHDNCVALGVTRAAIVSVYLGEEHLMRAVARDRARNNACMTVLAVHVNGKIGLCRLFAVRHYLLVYHERRACRELCSCRTDG